MRRVSANKQTVINSLKRWNEEVGAKIGWTPEKLRILTGSVGVLESTIESEVPVEDLAELSASWEKLGMIEAHKEWSKEIEPYVVSGTSHWQVFSVV